MKSFKAYLTESHHTYDFKVRLACELPDDMMGKIKSVLEAYKVSSVSKPKRLPIQETPEFPSLGPVEINIFDVSLHYPCNDEQVRTLIAERCGLSLAMVKVTPAHSPYEAVASGLEKSNLGDSKQSVLLQDEMKAEKVPANLVGDARIPELIKELEETRKYEYSQIAGGKTKNPQTTNDVPVGKISPLGSHKPKLPSLKK
jgi:hypothetical protein